MINNQAMYAIKVNENRLKAQKAAQRQTRRAMAEVDLLLHGRLSPEQANTVITAIEDGRIKHLLLKESDNV